MLTQSQVHSAKPTNKPRKLFDARGLYLKVMPNGGRYWRFDYQFDGKYKTLALGIYPDVSLARARERHQEARVLLADGVDPGAVKQAVSQDFETVARAWLAHWRTGRSERYVGYVIARLEGDIFPDIGSRPISELTTSNFRDAVRKIEQRNASEIARRLLQNCGQIMRFAVANDLVQRNPVADIRPGDIFKPRKKRNYPRIFDGISLHTTRDGKSVIVEAGPGHEINALYRARVFSPYDQYAVQKAISEPASEIGPPPYKFAKAGRMNARGISVFYGATKEAVALAEVRPPVGAHVAVGRFEITRTLRLLDVKAFQAITASGSLFDPITAKRLRSARFLAQLGREITMPVMPDDESSDYLVTQAIADYLAGLTDPVIDGIIYKSIQHGADGTNVTLFHKSSRVAELDRPKGTEVNAHAGNMGEDDDPCYIVWEETPPAGEAKKFDHDADFDVPLVDYVEKGLSNRDDDAREAALTFDTKTMKIHHVTSVQFSTCTFEVTRHRMEKREMPF